VKWPVTHTHWLHRLSPLPDATQISLIKDGKSIKCSNEVFHIIYSQWADGILARWHLVINGLGMEAGPSKKRKV